MKLKDVRLATEGSGPLYYNYIPVPVEFVGIEYMPADMDAEADLRVITLVSPSLIYYMAYRSPEGLKYIKAVK